MKIAIIGGTGLLGSNLIKIYRNLGFDVRSFSRNRASNVFDNLNVLVDFCFLKKDLKLYFQKWRPDLIINAVAIVDIKFCEENPLKAKKVNSDYAEIIASVAKYFSSIFVQISTDHFYQDEKKYHSETDPVCLLNQYAYTKKLAEEKVLNIYSEKTFVLRTNIIGYRNTSRPSFFEWLLNALQNNDELILFDDYFFTPISVSHFANFLLLLVKSEKFGLYNIAGSESVSKLDFGYRVQKKFKFHDKCILVGSVLDYNKKTGIKRLFNNGLDVSKIEMILNLKMPTVNSCVERLHDEFFKISE